MSTDGYHHLPNSPTVQIAINFFFYFNQNWNPIILDDLTFGYFKMSVDVYSSIPIIKMIISADINVSCFNLFKILFLRINASLG